MFSRMLKLGLFMVIFLPVAISADVVKNDDLIVTNTSDGSAPAYDCSVDVTLPFYPHDASSVLATIPYGDPIIKVEPIIATCDFTPDDLPNLCEYTCETPDAAMCVGQDCVSGESFNEGEKMRLKENNLRIRYENTSVDSAVLDRSWSVEANSSKNNGASYFDFELKSFEQDVPRLVTVKDGAQPVYDCSEPVPINDLFSAATGESIPVGDPLLRAQFVNPYNCNGDFTMCEIECVAVESFEEKSVLLLGPVADPFVGGGVALGYESAAESDVISIGRVGLLRRIAHVALGINSTDALTLGNLDQLSQQIADANTQLDAIQADIIFIQEGQFQGATEQAVEELEDLLGACSGTNDEKRINKAIDKLNKVFDDPDNWTDSGELEPNKAVKVISAYHTAITALELIEDETCAQDILATLEALVELM